MTSLLYAAFPTVARTELDLVFQALPLANQEQLHDNNSDAVARLVTKEAEILFVNGYQVRVPYRVYFAEPSLATFATEEALTHRQRSILHCIYLRHHNGFVRQRRLELLLAGPVEALAMPFVFSLLGDYVKEILEVLEANLTLELLNGYVGLIRENPRFWQRTQGRVASYWDVYYRGRHRGGTPFRQYVGARLVKQLQQAVRQVG
ncbi:hypothetical protein [Hymenobacter sp. PAMC 26628]|uniref:hypothetical protein n=1 Tax=Hymenobacter sp. PAMC 26628 TaxID=1484118 RepID=UPI00077007FE|nr:hypothetical protein [Hymenobacter sp. PAMC 26628]AMJ65567.1 hypothetical protein AXW84_09085 [Hymenobacter sp. PAMC 26628]